LTAYDKYRRQKSKQGLFIGEEIMKRTSSWLSLTGIVASAGFALLLIIAGCSNDSEEFIPISMPTSTPPPPSGTSPGSGLFVVDCDHELAYVPLSDLNPSDNGQVAVIDLSVDPDVANPVKSIVPLTHSDIPTGTALDNKNGLVLVVSGKSGTGGFLDIINQSGDTLVPGSPFNFPTGSEAGNFGQVLYDPVRNKGIVATLEIAGCTNVGGCTGFSIVDPVTHSFSPIIPANYPETFAFDSALNTIIDASDDDNGGEIGAVSVADSVGCTLADSNIGDDNDGSSIDSTTNILVVSNEDGTATVVNLHGSSFANVSTPPCQLNEGGTPPNSVLVSGLPTLTAGSAVNAVAHEAFLIEDGQPGVSVLGLPAAPLTQITSGDVAAPVIATLPNDPDGSVWGTKGDPYAVAISSCDKLPSRGYAINSSFTYLVEVDMAAMKANPGNISTPLPAGNCVGTATTFGCNNGNGVKFFPLP
jgi:hypothetical protein